MDTPSQVEDLTPSWFSEVLGADIRAVEVIDAHSGTTGRAKVRVTSDDDVPETLFVKLQPFTAEQRQLVQMVGMGIAEARLYDAVGAELPVRIPRVWHSSFDESDGSFIMVLEDLIASGCRFPSAEDDDVGDFAGALMDELALLHATYVGQTLPWIRTGSEFRTAEQQAAFAAQAGGFMQSALDQFADDMPASYRQLGEAYCTRFSDLNALYLEGERTLVHGDNHIGNLFIDRDGRPGFYDWAIATKLPGMRDVAYFLTNSLPTEVRRKEQDGLLARYRAGLAEHGVSIDAQTIQDQYRLFAIYSWSGATTTASMGSKWQPIEIGYRAMVRTTEAIDDLDSVGLVNERLGNA